LEQAETTQGARGKFGVDAVESEGEIAEKTTNFSLSSVDRTLRWLAGLLRSGNAPMV
jgi:hypothetical protein